MKLFSTVLIICVHVSVFAFGQRITLTKNNAPLTAIMKEIKKQSGYYILYDADALLRSPRIDIKVKEVSVSEALEQSFAGLPLQYVISDKSIIVSKRKQPPLEVQQPILQQEVAGRVINTQGNPLEGVTVGVKNSQSGTVTNINGYFKIGISKEKETLLFSAVGYITQEHIVSSGQPVNIVLEEVVSDLDEVVVVGYGTQKKTSVTAAVSTMKGEEIADVPVANISNSLGGRLPGLIVRQNSGEPGRDGSNIYIRGVSTTGNSQPLLIVDGIPRGFQNLDPNTIASVTVLKDAAAVAPYGVAGANGVILVTTKRGTTGMPTVTYNGYMGFQNPTVLPELPNAYQYASLKNAASLSVGGDPLYNDASLQKFKDGSDPDGHPNQNVYDMLFDKNTPLTAHNIELSGGSDKINYYSSVGYQYQAGIWSPTNQHRFNYSVNLDAHVTNTTKLSLGINGREQTNAAPTVSTDRLFELVHYASPIRPILFSNGESGEYIWNNVHGSGTSKTNVSQMYTQLSIEQELPFIPGLMAKASFAFDPTSTRNKAFRTPSHLWSVDTTQTPYVFIDGIFEQTKASLNQSFNYSKQLVYQGSLNYNKAFGSSNIGGLVVFEAKSNDAMNFSALRRNYNLSIDELSMGSSSVADIGNAGSSSSARQMGLVYRLTYDYANKYLFEASGRYDGSYYFAKNKRWGYFPAFSLGWRMSEEEFMKDIDWVSNLKIRGSYGEVGALAGSPFQYQSLYSIYGPAAVLDGGAVQAASEGIEPNPNITWERAKKTNIGLEINLWRGRVNLEADYFKEHRSNMLASPTIIVPVEYGVGLSQVNAAEMSNQGIDLSLSSTHRFGSDLNVTLGTNFTYAKNKLLQVFETDVTYSNPNRRVTGRSLGTRFGYESVGYFQVEDFDSNGVLLPGVAKQPWGEVFPGDVRYKDVNQDGKIDNNDIVPIGEADVPQIIYGIFSSISYKSVALDFLFQGAGKTNIYGPSGYWHPFNNGRGAYMSNMDYWTPENRDASHARITPSPTTNNNQVSSYLMFNSRYLRLKNINLSFTLPQLWSKKIGMQQARIFVSGQNLLTFTPIINYDPEIINSQALDYPQQRVISMGANLTF